MRNHHDHDHKEHRHEPHEGCCGGHGHKYDLHEGVGGHGRKHEPHEGCCGGHGHKHEPHEGCCGGHGHHHTHEGEEGCGHHGHHHALDHDHHEHHDHGEEHLHTEDNEEPAVASFTRAVTLPSGEGEEIRRRYQALLEGLSAWAEEREALVGHIKMHLERGGETLWLSTTGGGVSARQSDGWEERTETEATLKFTAILYGLETDELERRVEQTLAQL